MPGHVIPPAEASSTQSSLPASTAKEVLGGFVTHQHGIALPSAGEVAVGCHEIAPNPYMRAEASPTSPPLSSTSLQARLSASEGAADCLDSRQASPYGQASAHTPTGCTGEESSKIKRVFPSSPVRFMRGSAGVR